MDGSLVRLRQLAAGHFALRLAPSEWPLPGAQRWRKLGQDGIVEVQVSPADWLSRKLAAHQATVKPEHEHLVAESSIQAADVANSGLEVDVAASQPLAQLAQKMSGSLGSKISSTTSTTRSPTSRSSRSSLKSNARPSGGVHRPHLGEMAAHGASSSHSCRVAHPRHALMVAAAALSTLCSLPLSKCSEPRAVAFAKRADDQQSIFGTSPCHSRPTMQRLHGQEPTGGWMVEKPIGSLNGFSGRSYVDWDAGSKKQQGFSIQTAEGSNRGSSAGGGEASSTRPRSRGCQSFGWTTRRTTSTERRPSQIGKSPSVGYPREGNGGAIETALSSNDQGYARSGFDRFIKFKPHR